MDSRNSAVYLWSSLPFSFRSPEIDAFILDRSAIIVLHLVCVNDGVDNRDGESDSELLHLDPLIMCYPGLTYSTHPPALVFKDSCYCR